MSNNKEYVSTKDLLTLISTFVVQTTGLVFVKQDETKIKITQKTDSKEIVIDESKLLDVIFRKDPESKNFIQINFIDGEKILITDQLIGFKPHPISGIDLSKMPKVVTTVDLFSVLEAIEDIVAERYNKTDLESLKAIYMSILAGGEKIGFDLSSEKTWLKRIPAIINKTIA
ncbi:MAG: hypothetical protein IPM57_01985 [Oligoflexia bacterium]|nr:hypothetical protein [Oligoflexia bacterium]